MDNSLPAKGTGTNCRALLAVRQYSKATGAAHAVLQTIALYVNRKTGEAQPSQATIGAESGQLSESTVRRAIRQLEHLGELETTRTWTTEDGKTHNAYSIPLIATGQIDRSVEDQQGQPVNLTAEYKGNQEIEDKRENQKRKVEISTPSPVKLTGRSSRVSPISQSGVKSDRMHIHGHQAFIRDDGGIAVNIGGAWEPIERTTLVPDSKTRHEQEMCLQCGEHPRLPGGRMVCRFCAHDLKPGERSKVRRLVPVERQPLRAVAN